MEPTLWQTASFQVSRCCARSQLARWGVYRLRVMQVAAAAQHALRRAAGRADTHRPGAARHAAAGIPQRVDAAARRGRAVAGGLTGQAVARTRAELMDGSSMKGATRCAGCVDRPDAADDLEQAFSRIPQELRARARVIFAWSSRAAATAAPDHPRRDVPHRPRSLVNAFRHRVRRASKSSSSTRPRTAHVRARRRTRHRSAGAAYRARRTLGNRRACANAPNASAPTLKMWSRAGAGTEVELAVPGPCGVRPREPHRAGGQHMSEKHKDSRLQRRRPSASARGYRRHHQQPAGHDDGRACDDRP